MGSSVLFDVQPFFEKQVPRMMSKLQDYFKYSQFLKPIPMKTSTTMETNKIIIDEVAKRIIGVDEELKGKLISHKKRKPKNNRRKNIKDELDIRN